MDTPPRAHSAVYRRVLLFSPAKTGDKGTRRLHLGLLSLAAVLAQAGHEVQVIDYSYLASLGAAINVPTVEDAIAAFRPDVIGLSVFTFLYDEAQDMLRQIHACSKAPVLVGGPHVTLFPEDFSDDARVNYIVRGESEGVIDALVQSASATVKGQVLDARLPALSELPRPNMALALGSEYLSEYQIQLSRGCPYKCTFCTVQKLAGNRIRPRDVSECLEELVEAKKSVPSLKRIIVTDDCPTYDMNRFKSFLRRLTQLRLGCELWTDNMRANLIDEELLSLYGEAGGTNVCIGVESGSPEVFDSIHKSETFSDIFGAAKLVRSHRLRLGLCFVIGLPGDNLSRHRESMRLARRLKPDYVFWNMCVAWPGTAVREWFETNGTIRDGRNFSTLMSPHGEFQPPVCASPDFTQKQRIAAWLSANLETHYYFTSLRDFMRLLSLSRNYGCLHSFSVYCLKYGSRSLLRACVRAVLHPCAFFSRRVD